MPTRQHNDYTPSADPETALLQRELHEAYQTLRALQRQLGKEQHRHAEAARAHAKTIENLAEAGRERALLREDRERWRERAEHAPLPFKIGGLTLDLTEAEIDAIRKAIARLHAADAERRRAWEAALDAREG